MENWQFSWGKLRWHSLLCSADFSKVTTTDLYSEYKSHNAIGLSLIESYHHERVAVGYNLPVNAFLSLIVCFCLAIDGRTAAYLSTATERKQVMVMIRVLPLRAFIAADA